MHLFELAECQVGTSIRFIGFVLTMKHVVLIFIQRLVSSIGTEITNLNYDVIRKQMLPNVL